MSLALRERLWRKRRFVPIRITNFHTWVDPKGGVVYARAMFRHPCPCEGWKLDKPFVASMAVGTIEILNAKVDASPSFKYMKEMMRREARSHIAEFERTGLIDGVIP